MLFIVLSIILLILGIVCCVLLIYKRYKISISDTLEDDIFEDETIPYELTGFFLYRLYHCNKEYFFLLDTGSNMSYIDDEVLKTLVKKKTNKVIKTIGLDSGGYAESKGYEVQFNRGNMVFKDTFYSLDCVKTSFNNLNSKLKCPISGILGISFIVKYSLIIDTDEKMVYKV